MADAPKTGRLILVAEDNDDLRRLLKTWLVGQGFAVLEAEDGAAAIRLCQDHVPDLALIDLQMPGVDGIMTIKHLRGSERLRQVPVIATSAFGEWAMDLFVDIENFGSAPIEYIAKPASIESLSELLNKLLNGREGD
jgi:CheY-like chemotaxis protein